MDSENELEAARRLLAAAREVCCSILDGGTTPYEGARNIAAMCRGVHPPTELHTFVYADSEWNERPQDGDIFTEGIIAAARELVRGNAP
jgi:hypothetical protein